MRSRHSSYGYVLATLALGLAVAWAAGHTWQKLEQLHRGFASAQTEDIYISRRIEGSLRELNDSLLRVNLRRDHTNEAEYQDVSRELQEWLHSHDQVLSTPEQRDLNRQIENALEVCLARDAELARQPAQDGLDWPASVFELAQSNAAPVLVLCHSLETSERAEQAQFMKDSQQALSWIRELLTVMAFLLISSLGTAIVALNRGIIGPLRVKLTESKALAERNEKLASLGTLAAGVAHEIRNPLTAINVRLHSLKKHLIANSSELEDALVIDHEIQRLEGIVRGFLQFARPAEPKLLTASVDSLISKVQSLFASQLAKASIILKVESLPDVWVKVDPHQIEQVLINLVQNAAESIGSNGIIALRVRTGKARLNGVSCAAVMLEISDTGKGIPIEAKARIFDPFFTTKTDGTGLGLPISLRILEKHGGTLECASEPNHGTLFTVILPDLNASERHESSS